MYRVIGIKKTNKAEIKTIVENLSEHQAENFCEAWGWTYDDGQHSYWLDYEIM